MKKSLYAYCFTLGLCSVLSAFGWTLYVTNWANKVVNIHTSWAGSGWAFGKCFSCCDDHKTLQPGQRVEIDAGACLLTELRVDGGSSYKSSGQLTKKEFHVIGPVQGQLRVGRIELVADGLKDGILYNATSFPATEVKVLILKCPRPRVAWEPQEKNPTNKTINAGDAYSFDLLGTFVNSIQVTINGKTISWEERYNRCGESRPTRFYIAGPPDGSDPRIIGLVQ